MELITGHCGLRVHLDRKGTYHGETVFRLCGTGVETAGYIIFDCEAHKNKRLEPRTLQAGVKSLAYYGGARGKFLIVHPSGHAYISNKPAAKGKEEEEEDVGMEESDNGDDESVAINTPPDNASVAEAKPVGLAVAGPGGVASSKPVATAVVGPGGLAIARPVATAIAGVSGTGPLIGLTPGGKLGNLQKQIYWNSRTNQIVSQGTSNDIYMYPINIY